MFRYCRSKYPYDISCHRYSIQFVEVSSSASSKVRLLIVMNNIDKKIVGLSRNLSIERSLQRPLFNVYRISTETIRQKSTNLRAEDSKSSSIFSFDIWKKLRWEAATMLTSTLSPDEQNKLLQKLDAQGSLTIVQQNKNALEPSLTGTEDSSKNFEADSIKDNLTKPKEHDELIMTNSIAEAIAQARAEEVQRLEGKWEKEKEEIMKQAQLAAEERIKSDILIQQRQIAYEKWMHDVRQANENQKKSLSLPTKDIAFELSEKKKEEEEEEKNFVLQQDKLDTHPILGPVILDLGYKRIHIMSTSKLSSIPIWKKQRTYRHDRAKSMSSDKMKSLHIGLPGIIGLYEDKDGKLSILDGQHRVGMLSILHEKLKENSIFDLDQILVEVYSRWDCKDDLGSIEADEKYATEIFLEINKAEPVKMVDMPGVAKKSDRKIITDAANRLNEKYPEMFRPSQKCRPPHVNIDNLRDAIFASNVLSRLQITSASMLEEWLVRQNMALKNKYTNSSTIAADGSTTTTTTAATTSHVSKSALEKANKHEFYLGLESSWLYDGTDFSK